MKQISIVAAALLAALFASGVSAPGLARAQGKDAAGLLTAETQVIPEAKIEDVVLELMESSSALYAALNQAYANNPTIQAGRAELDAVRENLPQAQAGFKPNVTADAAVEYVDTDVEGGAAALAGDSESTSKVVGVNMVQPIYRGGRTVSQIRTARSVISAQESILLQTENQVLLDAATAYMNVLRDEAVLNLRENNEEVIQRQLDVTGSRFEFGEVTRTDVSQAEARLAAARAELRQGEGNLRGSRAIYEEIVGQVPESDLLYPEIRFALPDDLATVIILAEQANPAVLAAQYRAKAAEENVDTVFGELLPQVSLTGGLAQGYDPYPGLYDRQRDASIGVSATIPLYESGSVRSRVRQAKHTANQYYMQIIEAKRRAKAQAIANWETLKAAQAEIKSRQAQIDAADVARKGVQAEADYGERTVLDALDADQEYLDAQVAMATARRDEIVAQFALAATLGLLTPTSLGFGETPEKTEKAPVQIDEDRN